MSEYPEHAKLQMLIYGHQIFGARHTSYEWARSKR
jgi:hypothetical protein